MFKKLLVFALCLCLVFSFCGCNFVRETLSSIIPSKNNGFIEGNTVDGINGAPGSADADVVGGNEVAGNAGIVGGIVGGNTVTEESSAPVDKEEYTLNDFMNDVSGVWIVDDTVSHMYDNEYSFSFYTIENNIMVAGAYPGGFGRPGKFVGIKTLENLVFQLDLLFEAGEYMGDFLDESRSTIQITFAEKEKLIVEESGGALMLLYAGKTLEEAKANAHKFVK